MAYRQKYNDQEKLQEISQQQKELTQISQLQEKD